MLRCTLLAAMRDAKGLFGDPGKNVASQPADVVALIPLLSWESTH
jgi:hypothetical protein